MKGTTKHIILKTFFRLLIVSVILLLGTSSHAQFEKFLKPNNSYGEKINRIHTDSAMVPALDTLTSAPDGSIAVKTGVFYVKWTTWHQVTGSGGGGFIGSNVFAGNATEATFHDSVAWWKNDTTLIFRKFEFISADSKLSITYPVGSRNTDSTTSLLFTINPGNILLSSLGGTLNLSQIAQGSATTGQVPMWNGSTWVPSSVSGSGSETDPLSIHNQRAAQATSFFNINTGTIRDTLFLPGNAYFTNYAAAGVNSSFLVMGNGVSGIGQNGTGADVWIAHAQFGGQFFPDAGADDIAYRNSSHNLLFGTGTGGNNSIFQIQHSTQTARFTKAATTIIVDTTAGKPLVVNSSGQVIGRAYWFGSGGGSGATPTLQQVSDAGSSTTTAITVQNMQLSASTITNSGAGFINLIGNNAGGVTFSFASTHKATIGQGLLTADRGYDLPDATGTFALTNQTMPTGGTTGQVLTKIDGTNYNVQWSTPTGGGGGSPGGTDQQMQFNDGGAFGGSTLKYNKTSTNYGLNATPNSSYKLEIGGNLHASASIETATSITAGSSLFQSSVYQQSTGSSPFFEYINSWASNGSFRWKGASGSTSLFELNGDQTIKAPGYAGTGNRNAYFDANGVWQRGSIDPANIQQIATVATALTAAGTNQSTALALSGSYSIQEVTTTASGTGVKLPTATAASWIFVVNRGANDLIVYPNTSGVINGQSANTGFTVQAGSTSVFIGKDGTSWYTEQAFRGGDVANADGNKALNINANAVVTSKINDAAVTYAKIQNVTAIRLLGRYTNSNGVAQEITIGSGLSLDNTTGVLTATSGGSGTVTSFSSGNLSPLFTTSVATATTTPALSFSLTNAAANTVFGNNTNASAAPAYFASSANGQVLVQHSGTLGFAALAAGDIPDISASYIKNQSASAQTSSSLYTSGAIKTDATFTGGGTNSFNASTIAWYGYGSTYAYIVATSTSASSGVKMWVNGGGDLGFQLDKDKSLTIPGVGLAADGNKIIYADATGKLFRGTIDPANLPTLSGANTFTNTNTFGSGSSTGMTTGSAVSVLLDNSANGAQTASIRTNQTASSTSPTSALQLWTRTTHSSGTVADMRTFVPVYDQGSANAVTEARVVDASALMSNTTGGTITTLKIFNAKLNANTSTATTITNSYGYYYDAQGGAGTITNTNAPYAFYNNDASAQSLFKGKVFLPSLGTTTSDKLVGILASTGDLANITLGAGLSLSGNTLTSTVSNGSLTVINDADYTVAAGITAVVYKTMTAGRTVTLPAASSNGNRIITIMNGGGGAFNITLSVAVRQNSTTTTTTLIPNKWIRVESDTVDWWIIENN